MNAERAHRTGQLVGLGGAAALGGIGAIHVAWARGSSFPFTTQERFNDVVVGSNHTPPSGASYAVAVALGAATVLVGGAAVSHRPLVRVGAVAVGLVLAVRAAFGLAGRTDVLVPGSNSKTFRRADRFAFAPLCVALSTSAIWAALTPR